MSDSLPPPKPRPKRAQMFMAMPLLFGALLMVSVMILGVLVFVGFTPRGERLAIRLEGTCAAEATPIVQRRINAIGLGDSMIAQEPNALLVTATLPGQDAERERAVIPGLLGQAGLLEVRDGEDVLLDQSGMKDAGLRLDENGAAMAVVELTSAAAESLNRHIIATPEEELGLFLDNVLVAMRPNTKRIDGTELRIIGDDPSPHARMAIAVDQVLVLQNGPLPCDLTVSSVVEVGGIE